MYSEETSTKRIERRFNRRGERKDREKPVKKFDDKKFNKSKHISKYVDDMNIYDNDHEEIRINQTYTEYVYDNTDTESVFSTDLYDDYYFEFTTSNIFRMYFKVGDRFLDINDNFISKINFILNDWNDDISNKFKKLASYIYHKYRKDIDINLSLIDVFKIHLSMFLKDKSINIKDKEIDCILRSLFFIARNDERYNYIFNNYRNITLFIINKMIRYYQFIRKKNQYLLFFKGFQQNIIPPIDHGLQEYIMSFVP